MANRKAHSRIISQSRKVSKVASVILQIKKSIRCSQKLKYVSMLVKFVSVHHIKHRISTLTFGDIKQYPNILQTYYIITLTCTTELDR